MFKLALSCLLATSTLGLVHGPRDDVDDPARYTVCGGDRGYTEKDSLEAAHRLENEIVFSDPFPMEREDCIFAHVNTTIVSLCNGNGRPRNINRAEVRRGINQLIQDCGLEGGFTGLHVVNNLTFAAYGVFGGINMRGPPGANPPDVPGGSRQERGLSKRDEKCNLRYDGKEHTDCDFKYKLNDDGSCGKWASLENNCEQFCELKRMGLLGIETRAPGEGGVAQPVTNPIEVTQGTEVSVTNGFSIGVEGAFKDVVGAGLSYSWSLTTTKSYAVTHTVADVDIAHLTEEELKTVRARFVYFPRLVKSCGTVSRSGKAAGDPPACGTSVCPPPAEKCSSEEKREENVCILSPQLNEEGNNILEWALRLEYSDGKALPMDRQSKSYRNLCFESNNPDGDEERECLNDNPNEPDFARMKREYEAKAARALIA